MSQEFPKNNIDLDALVNDLLSEKAADAPTPDSPVPEPFPAPPAADEDDIPIVGWDEPEGDDEPEEEEYPDASSEDNSHIIDGMEEELSTPHRRNGFFFRRLFRREKEERFEDEWADWGLTPIGHYRVEDDAEEETTEPAETAATTEESPVEPTEPAATEEPETSPAVEPTEPEPTEEPEPEPTEEAEKVDAPAAMDEFPVVQHVDETVPLPTSLSNQEEEAATRVIPAVGTPATGAPAPEQAASPDVPAGPAEQLPDQMSLEELVRVEEVPDAPTRTDDEAQAEERLRRTRQEKIRDFTLAGEEEVNEPEEEADAPAEEEPVIEDFTRYEDTKAVQTELQYRRHISALSLSLTGILELVLLALTLITTYLGQSPITDVGYLTVQGFALILMAVLNAGAIRRGMNGLFMLKANNDTAPALVTALSLCGVLLHFLNLRAALPLWVPLAGMPLLLNAVGQWLRLRRIQRNFTFVSHPRKKYAASLIEDEKARQEIGQRVVIDGPAKVMYFRPTGFLSDYLHNAYDEDAGDDWARVLTPIFALGALGVSLALVLLGKLTGFWDWMHAFLALLCLSAAATFLAVQLPLQQCSRHMLSRGGFLAGWKAVRQFDRPDAVVVDVADLYPDESILLHGIKTFSGAHIDDAILDAASLAVRSGGPLAHVFRRIIQDRMDMLKEVDSLVYEQGMGLSGWVDGRRVLIGNRRLLQNHGVDVPSSDYEARYAKNGRQLVYLSTTGELSAMFVVSYQADPTIKKALQDLCRAKVSILIRSCDANVTAARLCDSFDLDEYYVDILPAVAGRMYDQMVAEEAETTPALLASNGHILGTAMAISACRSLRIKSRIALIVQLLAALAGLVLGAFWSMGGVDENWLAAWLFLLVSTVLTGVVPLFKRL